MKRSNRCVHACISPPPLTCNLEIVAVLSYSLMVAVIQMLARMGAYSIPAFQYLLTYSLLCVTCFALLVTWRTLWMLMVQVVFRTMLSLVAMGVFLCLSPYNMLFISPFIKHPSCRGAFTHWAMGYFPSWSLSIFNHQSFAWWFALSAVRHFTLSTFEYNLILSTFIEKLKLHGRRMQSQLGFLQRTSLISTLSSVCAYI